MRMFNPPHPGEILKEDVLPELGITVGNFTAHLGISRPHLSKVLNGRASITAEMDLKLSEAFGQPPGLWTECRPLMIFGRPSSSHGKKWRR